MENQKSVLGNYTLRLTATDDKMKRSPFSRSQLSPGFKAMFVSFELAMRQPNT
jgi:hypothetical protein